MGTIQIANVDEQPQGLQVVESDSELPEGVFLVGTELPPERVEIFRVNGRVYTVARRVDPRVVFKLLRDIKRSQDSTIALSNLMYSVLGEGVMEFLAEEQLSDEEFEAVMKAVQKHTMKATNRILGN